MTPSPTTSSSAPPLVPSPGLTSAEAAQRLATYGGNRVPTIRPLRWWQRLLMQLRDPMMLVLIAAVVLTIATGDATDSVIIALVIVANTAVGVAQEVRADHAIAALAEMAAPHANVMRDGQAIEVSAEVLVPGDTVLLADGDVVPADGVLTDAAELRLDESSLTGEPWPQHKDVEDTVSAGTTVVHGRGAITVSATGATSALGRTAAMIGDRRIRTPLQRRLATLSGVLSVAAGAVCLLVMTIGLLRGQPAELMVVTAVSLAVAAIPESLPAVVTLSLALGARRMSRRQALVRRLAAVESLGSVTVLATDKTGTLTEGRMTVESVWPCRPTVTCAGAQGADAVLAAVALCSDAQVTTRPDGTSTSFGDPTEVALVAAAAVRGLHREALVKEWPRAGELPFDSDRRRMTTVHGAPGGGCLVVTKGAPRSVLRPEIVRDPPERLAAVHEKAEALATQGYRVLAVAARQLDYLPADLGEIEHDLVLLGLVALDDPIRAEAATAVADVRAAGIDLRLVTGDHAGTARAVARRVGIAEPEVFARTTPARKLELIRGWRDAGEVVAMTGDGVNDAPALHAADIGVAMGRRGTEVARQAADVVLADDNLATLVHAVGEGRRVYANIRRFLLYGMAGGLAELVVMLVGPAFGFGLALLPAQILWINLLTHGLPGVALGAEPADRDVLTAGPRPPRQPLLGGGLWQRIVALGAVMAVCTLGAALWARSVDAPWQTVAFLVLATSQLGVALGVRSDGARTTRSPLLLAVPAAAALALAGVYLPLLQELLGTESLPLHQLPVAAAIAVVGYASARATVTKV